MPARVAHSGREHAGDGPELLFRAPEAAHTELDLLFAGKGPDHAACRARSGAAGTGIASARPGSASAADGIFDSRVNHISSPQTPILAWAVSILQA